MDSSTDGARTRPSYRTRIPKYIYVLNLPTSPRVEHAVDPASTPQPPDARTNVPREELRRGHPTRRSRPTRLIPHTPTDAFAALAAVLVGTLGTSSFSLPTVERELLEIKVGLRKRAGEAPTPTSPVLWSAPSPTQHEVLRTFLKCLLDPKRRAASPGTLAVSPGAGAMSTATARASGKAAAKGPRASRWS